MGGTRKTYWHLGKTRRLPSEYEIATSRLLYYVDRGGFAVDVPAAEFYARNQRGSQLQGERWEDFADPRTTTYAKYVGLQKASEDHLARLLIATDEDEHDRRLAREWVERFGCILSSLRFLCHGLQMTIAYVGHMAPSGRIAVTALFQCGDEIRRIQRLAQRVAQIAREKHEIIAAGRADWQSDPSWQPLRRALERLLVTYDWGEAIVALNLCLKPLVDDVFLIGLARQAERSGDHLDAQILRALFEDCAWHRSWTDALIVHAVSDRPENRDVIGRWIEAWSPAIDECARAAAGVIGLDEAAAVAGARSRLQRTMSRRPPDGRELNG